MKHLTTTLLQDLDRLYYSDLAEYEENLQTIEQQVKQTFPGFTIALAEIYTVGAKRDLQGGMRHVMLPLQEGIDQ